MRRSTGRARRGVGALLACLALAGCGSTVNGRAVQPDAASQGFGAGTGPSTVRAPAGVGGPAPAVQGGQAEESFGPDGGTAWSSAAPAPVAGRVLRATTTTLRIGFVVPDTTLVVSYPPSATHEDLKAIVLALVDDLNERGGLAGRQVVADVYTVPLDPNESSSARQSDEEAACRSLTEDDHVFAVIAIDAVDYSAACFAQHGTPVFTRTASDRLDDAALSALAPWVLPDDTPDLDTMAHVMADAFARKHVVDKHMAVAAPDTSSDRRAVEHVLIPALQRYGGAVNPGDVAYVVPDAPDAGPAARNAVLRWNQDRVREVVIFDAGPGGWPMFATAAQSAGFTPTWLLDSLDWPQYALDDPGDSPPPTERSVVQAAWYPIYDVHDSRYPLTAQERQCLATVNAALGTSYSHRAENQGDGALFTCRALALAKHVLAPFAGRALVASQLAARLHALGARYHPPDTPGASFAPSKSDGLDYYRTAAYDSSCTCMTYDSPWTPLTTR